jgi:hypothetical protein
MLQITDNSGSDSTEIAEWVQEVRSPAVAAREIAALVMSEIVSMDAVYLRIVGHVVRRLVKVDGQQGRDLALVKPDGGEIEVEWDVVSDVLIWIGQTLRDRSPVVSGRYREGHTLYAGDEMVAIGAVIPAAARYTFINLQPYARKIEIGKTRSGRDFVIQVPNRIYERTANDASARFGNIARITFDYERTRSVATPIIYVDL